MPLDRYTILFTAILAIESLSYAIVLPYVPFMAQEFGANELVIGSIFALYSVCQLVSAPLLGAWSDKWDRKPLLILSQVTTLIGFVILAFSQSLAHILLSRLVDGASAGNVSLIYTAVVDRYPKETRTAAFGLLSIGVGLGLVLGPLLGGLFGSAGLALPAWVAVGLTMVTITLTVFLFPKRSPTELKPKTVSWRESFGIMREPVIFKILRVILINTIIYNAFVLGMPIFLQRRLAFGPAEIGGMLTGILVLGAIFQVVALPKILTSLNNRTSAQLGLGCYLLGFVALWFAPNTTGVIMACVPIVCGIVILNPVLSGALANQARGVDDGALMGVNQAITSGGQIIGPLIGYAALYFASGEGFAFVGLALTLLSLFLLKGIQIYA